MDVFGSLDPPVAAALSNLGSTLDLSPQRLFDHWEAFACALKDQPDQPTLQHTGPFRNYLQMQMQKKPTLTKHSIEAHIRQRLAPRNTNAANQMTTPVKQKHLDMLSSPAFGASAFSSPPAPISSRKLPQSLSQPVHSPTTPALSASRLFSDRPNRGIIVDTFNPHVPYTTNCNERVAVSLVPGQQTLGYRYMYEKLTEKGDLLDERIRYFEPLLAADHLARLLSQEQSVLAGDEMQIDGGITIKKETDATQIDEQVKSQELLDPDMDPLLLVTSPSHPFQNTHFYVGRICIDSLAISSSLRLNDKSLLLEPSRFTGSGVRVNLNLAPLVAAGGGYSLFPGQIVGIEATNPSGRSLNVSKLHLPPQLPIPTSNTTQLRNYYPSTKSNQSTHIVTASGPYALSDSLWFEPLADLVATLIKDTPDVLILLGPFVSINHPLIENGMIDMSPNEIFKQRIAPILKQLVDSTALKNGEAGGVQIILVPSTSDACSEYLAFPQPPLASAPIAASADAYNNRQRLADMGLDTLGTNVLLFPNPVQFTVNELVVCVSSIDTVFDINQAQLTHAATAPAATETGVLGKSDRIAGVFQHVLNQRCLYPLYPPASGANLDTTRALSIISTTPTAIKAEIPDMDTHMADENDQPPTGATQLVAIPDILIIPSRLQPTTKQIGQTLCVNPGHMTKNGSGKSAGGYARIVVHGFEIPEDAGTNDEVVEHCVADRARVQIMRV